MKQPSVPDRLRREERVVHLQLDQRAGGRRFTGQNAIGEAVREQHQQRWRACKQQQLQHFPAARAFARAKSPTRPSTSSAAPPSGRVATTLAPHAPSSAAGLLQAHSRFRG